MIFILFDLIIKKKTKIINNLVIYSIIKFKPKIFISLFNVKEVFLNYKILGIN